jgi:H+-translocating NAD(P) transhydrogenase subunit alpha
MWTRQNLDCMLMNVQILANSATLFLVPTREEREKNTKDENRHMSYGILLATQPPVAAPEATAPIIVLLLTVFVLAVFVGFEIITKIPPTLHTPLMSGSNAISGITITGALLMLSVDYGGAARFLGFLAVVLATMNVVGGFLVTHRMLGMFRRKD